MIFGGTHFRWVSDALQGRFRGFQRVSGALQRVLGSISGSVRGFSSGFRGVTWEFSGISEILRYVTWGPREFQGGFGD